jgi:catalase-peroxidase
MTDDAKCPVPHGLTASSTPETAAKKWWPNELSVESLLHNSPLSDPYGPNFDYVAEFKTLDLDAVKADITSAMKDSKSWWPADYGHYGPFFIRMAWHSAGTYRTSDGRGGAGQGLQRFAPLNSWPDNVNLDKARRLLWPVKQKYGRKLSWADLMILAGNVALEDMGFKTFGFAGGRADVWEPDNTYWGSETEWLANGRYDATRDAGTLENPLAAVQMGLIYVNPEGPDGNPDFKLAAADIRETFGRMAMNDEETVALIAGGHAFGKTHGAGDASQVGKEPEGAEMHQVGLGWSNPQGKGNAEDTISSGLEVTWTPNPTQWDNDYLRLIYKYEWEIEESPAGAKQWKPVGEVDEADFASHAHLVGKKVAPRMLTTDLALRFGDEEYDRISRKFLEDFDYFSDAFARAWFKLTHRDMGPLSRYHGAEVPKEALIWQDPIPETTSDLSEEAALTLAGILDDNFAQGWLTPQELIKTAWASASTFRNTDKRGGANGARVALEPQSSWDVNEPEELAKTLSTLKTVELTLNSLAAGPRDISLADLIVFAGSYAVQKAAEASGSSVKVSYVLGRGDATQEETDIESFEHLRPLADGFRNWAPGNEEIAERLLIEKAALLGLTPTELTVLIGGLRVLGANHGDSTHGVLTDTPGVLDNSFFRNLLSNDIAWAPKAGQPGIYGSHAYKDGERKWTAARADIVFASNSVLRAIAEVYASDDANEKFVQDFVSAWTKVMNADLF